MEEEYNEGLRALGEAGMLYYKCLSLFRVRTKDLSIRFGHNIVDEEDLRLAELQTFKTYLDEQKQWIREIGRKADPKELKRRMWWLLQKMFEFGFFTASDQATIVSWCLATTSQMSCDRI